MKTNQIRNGNPYFKIESYCRRTMCWRPIKGVHQAKESAMQAKPEGSRVMYFNGKTFEEVIA